MASSKFFGSNGNGVEVSYNYVEPSVSMAELNNAINRHIKGQTSGSKKVSKKTIKYFNKQARENAKQIRYKLGENSESFMDIDNFHFYGYMSTNGKTILQSLYDGDFDVGISDLEYGYKSIKEDTRIGPQNIVRKAIESAIPFYKDESSKQIYSDYMQRIQGAQVTNNNIKNIPNYSKTFGDKYAK